MVLYTKNLVYPYATYFQFWAPQDIFAHNTFSGLPLCVMILSKVAAMGGNIPGSHFTLAITKYFFHNFSLVSTFLNTYVLDFSLKWFIVGCFFLLSHIFGLKLPPCYVHTICPSCFMFLLISLVVFF